MLNLFSHKENWPCNCAKCLLYPLSCTQVGGQHTSTELNRTITCSRGLLNFSKLRRFNNFSHFSLLSEWVFSENMHSELICPYLVLTSAEILFTLKQQWFFCAFLCDKDSHLGTGLCYDRQGGGRADERWCRSGNTHCKQSEWWKQTEC